MLLCIPCVGHKTAMSILHTYTIDQILLGQTEKTTCYNILYLDSKFRLGTRGEKIHNVCNKLHGMDNIQQKIIACINGITTNTAKCILEHVCFSEIISSLYDGGAIANIQLTEKRKVGNAIEERIKMTFYKEHTLLKNEETI